MRKIIEWLKLKHLSTSAVRLQCMGRWPWGHVLGQVNTHHHYKQPPLSHPSVLYAQLGQLCSQVFLARTTGARFKFGHSRLPNSCFYCAAILPHTKARCPENKSKNKASIPVGGFGQLREGRHTDSQSQYTGKYFPHPRGTEGADAHSQKDKKWGNPWGS